MSSTIVTAANSPSTNQSTTTTTSTTNNTSTLISQDNGEPPFLAVGTEVSAKYKGAFCEATIQKVERLVKCRVTFKNNFGTAIVIDDNIRGNLRVGATIEAKHPDKNGYLEATISKIIDASQYTVIFDDGDVTSLRRTSLCLKSGKHFAESESLDHLPLTNPEHFGNPVSLNSRGNRRRRRRSAYSTVTAFSNNSTNQFSDNDDNDSIEGSNTSVDDEDSSSIITHQSGSTTSNFKLNSNSSNGNGSLSKENESSTHEYGKVVCIEFVDKRSAKFKDLWFPGLVVNPSAQADNGNNKQSFDPSQDCLVKSFSNGRFYQIKLKDTKEFTKELGNQILNDSCSSTSIKSAIEKAINYLDKNELPPSWDFETLIGSPSLNESDGEDENESSDDLDSSLDDEDLNDSKSVEEKDRFVAQLYKYMDERGTPINKTPTIWGVDLDLYNLYRLVIKMGGYNRVCNMTGGWKAIYTKLNLPNTNQVTTQLNANQLRLAYKKYLLNFVDFFRKLGCTMSDTCLYSSRGGSTRTARSERNWRTLSDSSKQQQQQDNLNSNKDKTRRKKSSTTNELASTTSTNTSSTVEKKGEDDKKSGSNEKLASSTSTTASTLKKTRKNGRKKFKAEGVDDSNVNGNEPEEKYIPNDSDFESDNEYNYTTPTISNDVQVNVGDRIRVKYGKGKQLKVYEAKVMNYVYRSIEQQKIKYFVHYTGWNTRYDEWIKRNRIVEVLCDNSKSPKRRGGNKSKNKGVPLSAEEQLSITVKNEQLQSQPAVKVEAAPTVSSVGKRGRPPSATSFRNQEKTNATVNEISSTSSTTTTSLSKSKNEFSTSTNNNKRPIVNSPVKRSRQRSECLEIDQDDNKQTSEDQTLNASSKIATSDVKKENLPASNSNHQVEEQMEVENEEDSLSETAKDHQPTVTTKRGYKKLKRSDSLRREKVEEKSKDTDLEQSNLEDKTSSTQKSVSVVVEDDLMSRRRQRKTKKNDKLTDQPTSTQSTTIATVTKEEIKQEPITSVSNKKRKTQQQNESSDEDDSSNSSISNNTTAGNLNKFSKRKRILNSKYRQDNQLNSKTESTTSSTSISTVTPTSTITTGKETESTRKRSKDETVKTTEKSSSIEVIKSKQQQVTNNSQPENNEKKEDTDTNDDLSATLTPTTTTAINSLTETNSSTNNFLLCKEEIPASPSCDDKNSHNIQSKNSSTLDTVKEPNLQNNTNNNINNNNISVQKSIVDASTKLCSSNTNITATVSDSSSTITTTTTTKETQKSKTESKQIATSHNNHSSSNYNDLNKKEIEDNESVHNHQQFSPPTTPESLKSNSTLSSHNDKDSNDEKLNDKLNENNNDLQNDNKIETHGLDMIAIGVSKLVDIDKQNDKKENNNQETTPNSNFSPRKKRRGRGRTSSQSESFSSNVTNNLFNTSFNVSNSNKDNSSSVKDSMYKVAKGCKTRGSLGRKVKQNQSNLDCMSESTSHSDNFEPTSPSSLLLNCISLESYNPTSKYNFCTPLDENLEADRRIQILHERLQELRKTYLNIKSELSTIERRRKKFKRKERCIPSPGSQTENINKTNSPQSSTSSTTLHRSSSFTENSNQGDLNEQLKEVC